MLFYSRKNRPFELGPYPLERLPHDISILEDEIQRPRVLRLPSHKRSNTNSFSEAIEKYKGMVGLV